MRRGARTRPGRSWSAEPPTRSTRAGASRISNRELTLESRLSAVEDADLPRTIVDLQIQAVSYQAALNATGRVLQPSLLEATLAEVADTAPAAWGEILSGHRAALRELANELTALTESTADSSGGATFLDSVRESLGDQAAQDDDELTAAVMELQLQEMSRQSAAARGQVLSDRLLAFLA